MMSVAVDTLKIYNRLRNANLDELAAREITEVFNEITEDHLAKKTDLEKTKFELKNDLEKFRSELKTDISKLRSELKADIEKFRSELKADIERSKGETIKWVAGMLIAQAALIATLVKLL